MTGNKEKQAALGDYKVVASAKRARPTSPLLTSSLMSTKAAKSDTRRQSDEALSNGEPERKQQQWAPIFGSKRDDAFQWKKSLGQQDCLRAEYGKPFERELEARRTGGKTGPVKVACFDLDGCIVRPKGGKTWPSPKDANDYEQAFPNTFAAVRRAYAQDGACIAILTNQDQSSTRDSKRIDVWRVKMASIARAIDCPMLILAAVTKDGFRKPGRLMWDHGVVQCYVEAGGQQADIDIEAPNENGKSQSKVVSFFVGDAAGRVGDHADTDRKWALNVGMPFLTPEEYFLGQQPKPYKLTGWRPTIENVSDDHQDSLPSSFFAADDPSSSDEKLDLVLFVGPPAAGKTTFYRDHFAQRRSTSGDAEYAWVNQDTLKTAAKCLSEARKHLTEGRSVVVDNTNRNVATRSHYIALARELGNVNVRCIFFDISKDLCWHNNLYRTRAGLQPPNEPRKLLPLMAFSSYFANLEKPTRREGFDADVVVIKWAFRGGEEARRRWLLQWE